MVERLAEVADKVIVIISRPTKAGRALPSGKVVDSNHAEQIWRAYLDKSPAGSKTMGCEKIHIYIGPEWCETQAP